jgi:hypothetical protein
MLFFIQTSVLPLWGPKKSYISLHGSHPLPSYAQKQNCPWTGFSGPGPLFGKRLSCVRVETSRNAGLKVQATTIASSVSRLWVRVNGRTNVGNPTTVGEKFLTAKGAKDPKKIPVFLTALAVFLSELCG